MAILQFLKPSNSIAMIEQFDDFLEELECWYDHRSEWFQWVLRVLVKGGASIIGLIALFNLGKIFRAIKTAWFWLTTYWIEVAGGVLIIAASWVIIFQVVPYYRRRREEIRYERSLEGRLEAGLSIAQSNRISTQTKVRKLAGDYERILTFNKGEWKRINRGEYDPVQARKVVERIQASNTYASQLGGLIRSSMDGLKVIDFNIAALKSDLRWHSEAMWRDSDDELTERVADIERNISNAKDYRNTEAATALDQDLQDVLDHASGHYLPSLPEGDTLELLDPQELDDIKARLGMLPIKPLTKHCFPPRPKFD